ncbi:MAG: hypothetical protein ACLS54_13170 [Anaerostipes hadrus]
MQSHSPNNVKAATKWNTNKSVTKEENGIKYSAYLTEDGKESWIYQIKLSKKDHKINIAKERLIDGKLTQSRIWRRIYMGKDMVHINIFGDTIGTHGMDVTEHCHIMTRI